MPKKLFLNSVSIVLPLLVFTFCGFYGATLGFGGGDDASSVYGIVDTITSWHYRPSRVWGYPGYEIPAAFIVKYFGLYIGNLYSFVWACVYLYFSYLIIKRSQNFYLVFPALALSPLLLINNSILLDYTQEAGLFVIAVWLALRYESTKDAKWLYFIIPVVAWDVLTRPDYVVFVGCLFLALITRVGIGRGERLKIFSMFAVAGLITIVVFYALNSGFENFTKINYLLDSPMWRRPPRAFFGIVIMLTPIGFLTAIYVLYIKRVSMINALKDFVSQTMLTRLFIFAIFLGLGRYFLQPDKLEFIFWEFTLFLFVLSYLNIQKYLVALITVPIALSAFVTVALFERDFKTYDLTFNPSLQYGAFIQKTDKRKWQIYRAESNFDEIVKQRALVDFPECSSVTFDQMSREHDCLIIDKWTMHQALGLTSVKSPNANNFRYILISDLPIDGWRGFRVSQGWESFDDTREYFEKYRALPLRKHTVMID
jgi:hypothetical protein